MTPKRRLPTDGESMGSGDSAASTARESLAPAGSTASPLEWALRYAAEGLRVLPLEPREKRPLGRLVPSGVHDATDDAETIRRWWTAEPTAGVGLAVPDDWAVIDVDPRNGGDVGALPELPDTLVARTGGGGYHVVLAVPEGMRFPGTLSKGVDVKQVGGYICVEPTIHPSGGAYRWDSWGTAAAAAPAWLLARAKAGAVAPTTSAADDRDLTDRERSELDQAAVLLAEHFTTGQRDNMALAIGGWLAKAGLPREAGRYLVGQLPSEATEARVTTCLKAWDKADRGEAVKGWSDLAVCMPADALAAVQALAVGPSARKGLLERLAARGERRAAERAQLAASASTSGDAPATAAESWPNSFTPLDLENDPPPVDWLIPDLEIGPGRTNMTAGFGNDGKTTISQQRNFDVALGRKLFGKFDVRRGNVLHLDYDGAGAIMLENYARLCRGHGVDRHELAQHLHVARPNKPLTDPDSYDWLCWLVESYTYCSIDALVAACPGLDENAVKEITVPLYVLERVSSATGVTFDVVHHETKPPNGTPAEARYALRGSSGIYGALSAGTTVRRAAAGDPNVREISCLKRPRFGFEPFGVRFVDVPDPAAAGRRYGAAMQADRASWGLRIEFAELSAAAPLDLSSAKADVAADRIEGVLRQSPLGWKVGEAKAAAGLDGPSWSLGIGRCLERGSLGTAPGGRNSVLLTFLTEGQRPGAEARAKRLAAFRRGGIAAVRDP